MHIVDHTSAVDISKTSGRSVDTSSGKHNCQHSKSARIKVAEAQKHLPLLSAGKGGKATQVNLSCAIIAYLRRGHPADNIFTQSPVVAHLISCTVHITPLAGLHP